MIYRIVKLHFQTTKTASFLELFNQVVTKVNEQPGCIEMYMIQDLHNPAILNVSEEEVSIKASTHEKVDSFGESKAIKAYASCLLEKNIG